MNAAIREHFRTGSEIVRVVASAWHRRKLDRAVRMFGARHGVRMGISPAAALTSTDRRGRRRAAARILLF